MRKMPKEGNLLKILMLDGSTFEMPNLYWQKAFYIKYGENIEKAIGDFRRATKLHFDTKTVPSKFGIVKWGEDYGLDEKKSSFKNHAELGEAVLHSAIRAALTSVALELIAKKFGADSYPSVLAVDDEGKVTEYTGFGKRENVQLGKRSSSKKGGKTRGKGTKVQV